MFFLCAKVPGWLGKYWLSAQPLALEEAGQTCRCEGGRADGTDGDGLQQGRARSRSGPRELPAMRKATDVQWQGGAGQKQGRERACRKGCALRPCQGRCRQRAGLAATEAARTGGLVQTCPGASMRRVPETPPDAAPLGRMARGGKEPLCAGQRRLLPDRPGGCARQGRKAPRRHRQRCGRGASSVIRHCGVSEGAQSGARSSKAV